MTTLDIIYNIILSYSTIALVWGTVLLLSLIYVSFGWLRFGEGVLALFFSTVFWPYTMYISLRDTIKDMFKSKPVEG